MTDTLMREIPMPNPTVNAAQANDLRAWVGFEGGAAILRRFEAHSGAKGFFLRTATDDPKGEAVREKALAAGFVELKTRGTLRMIFPDGKFPFSARQLADILGGHTFRLTLGELMSDKWTIQLPERAPGMVKPSEKAEIQPNPAKIETIGLNIHGEEVIRDDSGRFFRKVNQDSGKSRYIHESAEDKPTLFLRATRREDLVAIASSLIVMAGRGTLHRADMMRVIEASLEDGPHGHFEMGVNEAFEIVREHMLREISAIAIENEASREKFIAAMRLSASTGFVLSRPSASNGMLQPSPAMIAFMRRAVRGQGAVSMRVSDDMKIALPRVERDDAPLQVYDLGEIPSDGIPGYVNNVLARHQPAGRTILRIPGTLDVEEFDRLRNEIGLNYALEAVAEISAAVADGVQDGPSSRFIFIGERRPEPLDALPLAAQRTFNVLTTDDLMNLERELMRSRARIRDFHDGVEAEQGAEDTREENARQRPYMPLSRVTEPFTMIPYALEGASAKSLDRIRRDFEATGGVDATVSSALGLSIGQLGEVLTAEQVDAVAMRMHAAGRRRGFLLADQTGVGKGRSLAAMARAHIRSKPVLIAEQDLENDADAAVDQDQHDHASLPGSRGKRRVLYFTESAPINAPDVMRDLVDVGAIDEISPLFLTSGSQFIHTTTDSATGEEIKREFAAPKRARRNQIMSEGVWPEEHDVIITTYSSFRGGEGDPSTVWLENALDENTLLVLDEAHNALNPKSRQGRNIRAAIEAVGPENVIYGTATPAREPSGMNLYSALLPEDTEGRLDDLLENMQAGGEVAQEAFATMLAEDGVMLRRDHDLSNIDFKVSLPDDALMLRYQQIMNAFSPVVELMIEGSSQISEHLGRASARLYGDLIRRGFSREAARAQTNELNQYSTALGSPLSNLARIAMNAIKIDQVVDQALEEIADGRKPLITFHSTNAALFKEIASDPDASDENLTLKDQIRRIHDRMYKITVDGERLDAREQYPDVAQTADAIDALIEDLDGSLSASPIDALVEKLEHAGIAVGEISGRTQCYRDGRIQRRTDRNRRETIDRFNDGELDVLIYNAAGATGGSYHSSPKFKDQRPRTMIELEAPTDVIKYVQSLGRGNRYGQVHNPRVVSVMTGLTPEMRILQQRNRKLRSLGASVDGNRSHPMLLDDVPDLLNKVGDEATRNVLLSMPALARRLGFPEFAEEENAQQQNDAMDEGAGGGSDVESLANKVLARSIMLTARDQDDLVQRIRMEFDALIEELDSRNANPLRPKQLDGQVELRATSLYSGVEIEADDIDTSAFLSPLYMQTGIHHFTEEAWSGEKLVEAVETCRRLYGSEGFESYAARITQNLPALLRPYLPEGVDISDALENPEGVSPRFKRVHARLTDLAWLLENIRPGVSIRFPSELDSLGLERRTIVGIQPPREKSHYDIPSAYKVSVISPGMSKPEIVSLGRLTSLNQESIFFRPGISETFDPEYLERFDRDGMMARRLPVQVLTGNILQAITEAKRHDLGSVSLYRDEAGQIHRGIVVAKSKVNMEALPVNLSGGRMMAEAAMRFVETRRAKGDGDEGRTGYMRMWGNISGKGGMGERSDAEMIVSVTANSFRLDMLPMKKATYSFYADRPGLYELMYRKPLPQKSDAPARASRKIGNNAAHVVRIKFDNDADLARMYAILELIDRPAMTDGSHREMINNLINDLEGLGKGREGIGEIALSQLEAARSAADLDAGEEDLTVQEQAEDPAEEHPEAEEPVALDELPEPDFDNIDWEV